MTQNLDFKPEVLIVGTFNPEFPENNAAEWFYGRPENNFWEVLPRLYGEGSMRHQTNEMKKDFCKRYKIAITDIITSIEDADPDNQDHLNWLGDFSDKNISSKFSDHFFTPIVQILRENQSIKYVYFTRGIGETFWRRAWRPVRNYASSNNMIAKTLMTPSNYAFYQQGKYNRLNPNNTLSIVDYIHMRWENEWHVI